jgi:hypothetical protein
VAWGSGLEKVGGKKRKSRLEAKAAFCANAVAISNGMNSLCMSPKIRK